MRESLAIQASLASAFLAQAWPSLREQALEHLARRREGITSLLVCGCGDSHFAAQGAEMALGLWTRRPVRAATSMLGGRYLLSQVEPTCLVVGISASGEVARTVEVMERAKQAGLQTLAVTGMRGSTLAEAAGRALMVPLPEHPFGPGLISYLASFLGLLAIGAALAEEQTSQRVGHLMRGLPDAVAESAAEQARQGTAWAEQVRDADQGVFLGSGPALGAAGYAAAKVLEACGLGYRAQDLEEWAHLEYFQATADLPTWILTSGGRETSRVAEIETAARTIGRRSIITRWEGRPDWDADEREALSPLGLWPAPVAFAHHLMGLLGETPFRSFGGGRSTAEGGGASRIRTSQRVGFGGRAEPGAHQNRTPIGT